MKWYQITLFVLIYFFIGQPCFMVLFADIWVQASFNLFSKSIGPTTSFQSQLVLQW